MLLTDSAALEYAFLRFRGDVYAFVLSRLHDRHDAEEMTQQYVDDTDRLGLGRPDDEPKASETIGPILELVQDLIDSGHAYATGGHGYGLRPGANPVSTDWPKRVEAWMTASGWLKKP